MDKFYLYILLGSPLVPLFLQEEGGSMLSPGLRGWDKLVRGDEHRSTYVGEYRSGIHQDT